MSLPGQPDAVMDVVSTATHVLDAFETMVKEELPEADVVYDEQLTFETGIKSYIAKNGFNAQGHTDFPVFLYNRSQMRWPPGVAPSRRLNVMQGSLRVGDGVVKYKATQNEFDMQFMYVCRGIETQERFEVAHQGETGISANRIITVNMGDPIGSFNYFLTYTDLTGKSINYEGQAYTAIMGTIVARGMYFTFTGTSALIKQINLSIYAKAGPPPDANALVGSRVLTS